MVLYRQHTFATNAVEWIGQAAVDTVGRKPVDNLATPGSGYDTEESSDSKRKLI